MEGVRRRKPAAGGDNTLEKESGGDGTGRTLHSYVMLLATVLLLSSCLLVWLLPDHPLATLIISGVDRSALLLSLTTPVYAVVLDAGSTGRQFQHQLDEDHNDDDCGDNDDDVDDGADEDDG